MAVKHRCFALHHRINTTAVKNFVEEISGVFTAKTVGGNGRRLFHRFRRSRLCHAAHSVGLGNDGLDSGALKVDLIS